ncbi:MAG: plasmid stabilization protein, partial [Micromonosporaceae bacterium]
RASKESVKDISPQRRGGHRSGKRMGPQGQTKQQLYGEARRRGVKGRSNMTKQQLEQALGR